MYGDPLSEDELKELANSQGHRVYKCSDSEADDIYFQHLLPRFMQFAANEGFNIEYWDKQSSKQPFEQLLEQTLDSWTAFSGLAPYAVVGSTLYLAYCSPTSIGGIPKNQDFRQDYLERHKLFSTSVYSADIQSIIEQNILAKRRDETCRSRPDLSWLFLIFGIILGIAISLGAR